MPIRVAVALFSILMLPVPAHIRADVARAALTDPPPHLTSGQSFKVPAVKHGKVSYFLSRDAKRSDEDVRLIGPRKSRVVVPATPTGTYRLLSCTGPRCAASRGQVMVTDGKPTQIIAFSDSRN